LRRINLLIDDNENGTFSMQTMTVVVADEQKWQWACKQMNKIYFICILILFFTLMTA